jgi:hypothetical protein
LPYKRGFDFCEWQLQAHLACKDVAELLPDSEIVACGKGPLLQAAVARPQRHPHRVWKCLELQVYFKRLQWMP